MDYEAAEFVEAMKRRRAAGDGRQDADKCSLVARKGSRAGEGRVCVEVEDAKENVVGFVRAD